MIKEKLSINLWQNRLIYKLFRLCFLKLYIRLIQNIQKMCKLNSVPHLLLNNEIFKLYKNVNIILVLKLLCFTFKLCRCVKAIA